MTLRFSSADYALAAVALGGVLLFGAQVMEHRFAMDPCPMCLMQRLWIFVAALAAYAGLAHNPPLGHLSAGDHRRRLGWRSRFGPPALVAIEQSASVAAARRRIT